MGGGGVGGWRVHGWVSIQPTPPRSGGHDGWVGMMRVGGGGLNQPILEI